MAAIPLMKIPNADFLERTGSENLSARLWRLPPGARARCTSTSGRGFYFVIEGNRAAYAFAAEKPLSVPNTAACSWPAQCGRSSMTGAETLWLIVGAPKSWSFFKARSRRWISR